MNKYFAGNSIVYTGDKQDQGSDPDSGMVISVNDRTGKLTIRWDNGITSVYDPKNAFFNNRYTILMH
ncbi:MAG: hypothetical protein EB127_13865 [Alphaproteobacteria bacterium]|nr:hypothetical protein [Alphaproteobacteria bacterium]